MLNNTWSRRFFTTSGLSICLWGLFAFFLPPKPSSSTASGLFWHHKIHTNNRYDIVVVGDSRIYRGIDPSCIETVMQDDQPIKVFNFGFSSAGLDSAFIEDAIRLLDTNAQPAILVLGVSPSALADENMLNTHYYQEKNRSYTEQLQRRYLNAFLGNFDQTTPSLVRNLIADNKEGYFQKHYENGWIASEKIPADLWKDLWMLEDGYKKAVWSLYYQTRLLRLIAGWEARGIEVVAFRPPAAAHFESAENALSEFPESAIAAQIEAVGGTWIDIEDRYQYKTYDGSHLLKSSAQKLSTYLAKQIHKRLFDKAQPLYRTTNSMEEFSLLNWSDLSPVMCSDKAFGGKVSNRVSPGGFSTTFALPMEAIKAADLQIEVNAWVWAGYQLNLKDAYLVVALEQNDSSIVWDAQAIKTQLLDTLSWNRVQHKLHLEEALEGSKLKVYIWNNGDRELWIDNFDVQLKKSARNE